MTLDTIVHVRSLRCDPAAAFAAHAEDGWTAQKADQRATFCGWPLLLRRFAALADSDSGNRPI